MTKLYVDADACPVKEEAIRVARRHELEVVMVSNQWLRAAKGPGVQRIVVGEKSWAPADRQDKAIRALGVCKPIFLDDEMLVMRAQVPGVVWIFERAS